MLTADDVRKALELTPFEGFARKKASEPPSDKLSSEGKLSIGQRMSGRSTRMICSALAAASTGRRVALYAKPMVLENVLKDRSREWAVKLGLNPDLIVGHLATAEIEFFDHTWYEF